MFHNSVPTLGTYALKMNRVPDPCQLCGTEVDSGVHALFKCPAARGFWLASQLGLYTNALPDDPSLLLQGIMSSIQPELFPSFANHLWALWKHRCNAVHGRKAFNAAAGLSIANGYDSLTKLACNFTTQPNLQQERSQESALNNDDGMHCWIDGSFNTNNEGGWAFVLLERGSVCWYGLDCGSISSPFHGELNACRLAMKHFQQQGIQSCTIHTDCQLLANLLNGVNLFDDVPWQCFTETQQTVQDFRFLNYSIVFSPREQNVIAHNLANYARINRVVGVQLVRTCIAM
ncbi:hypothetical protein LUZ63_018423 [Rhynchospora breviuscula]|uniref:RNase H type-1 domain-containing protein n=1 Tax=Rhynchospora breviuscula TaxID=2022672 RepID=A0A9Q0C4A5_9POAL|nr:hypothetical protein LUZ63_018423 [Rhynchospora breviuscula]